MSIHPHRREGPSGSRQLGAALAITISVMIIEVIAGVLSGSIALLADAAHMLTDASALSLALFAAWIATRPATPEKTYGYYRSEILAALVNGVALWLLVAWIWMRALQRFHHPPEVHTVPMLAAATLGLFANLLSAAILSKTKSPTLNIRGAQLHVLGDALGSCGVIAAGLLIQFKGWRTADPMASMFIGFLIALSSWVLVKQSVNVLLEATPAHLNLTEIIQAIREVPGVHDVHDVHLWTITTGLEAMSGHLLIDHMADGPVILEVVNAIISGRFGITHTTFQLEPRPATARLAQTP